MKLQSSAFDDGQTMDEKYTCSSYDLVISPPFSVADVPSEAKSLALVLDDQESGDVVHTIYWFLFNIDPKTGEIEEGKIPKGAVVGTNSFGRTRYEGPCPPENDVRDFRFILYALHEKLPEDATLTYGKFRNVSDELTIETAVVWVRVHRPSGEIRFASEQAANQLSSFTNEQHK